MVTISSSCDVPLDPTTGPPPLDEILEDWLSISSPPTLLIRRHSELSATDWDTGILARFIAPPLPATPHPPRRAARRGTVWQRPLGHKLTSRSKADSSQNSPKVVNT
ncbi:hypothetical protein J6590_107274 [Homalodisca vitripennis]|nr:hypothetical protein J6590_074184 [Homalodisca vitripennis]KAG8303897.1 hypothetical protein J6590_107274 [Homalodisca vitripennis]